MGLSDIVLCDQNMNKYSSGADISRRHSTKEGEGRKSKLRGIEVLDVGEAGCPDISIS